MLQWADGAHACGSQDLVCLSAHSSVHQTGASAHTLLAACVTAYRQGPVGCVHTFVASLDARDQCCWRLMELLLLLYISKPLTSNTVDYQWCPKGFEAEHV